MKKNGESLIHILFTKTSFERSPIKLKHAYIQKIQKELSISAQNYRYCLS